MVRRRHPIRSLALGFILLGGLTTVIKLRERWRRRPVMSRQASAPRSLRCIPSAIVDARPVRPHERYTAMQTDDLPDEITRQVAMGTA